MTIEQSMAYKNVFSGEHGEFVLNDLDRFGFFTKPDKACDLNSVNTTYFNLGKLAIIRYIHDNINKVIKEETDKAEHKEVL